MNFLVRVDASPAMGTGHVMRCLAVAEALDELGHHSHFVMAETTTALDRRLAAAGVFVREVTAEEDAAAGATRRVAEAIGAAGIIVDGYHFAAEWRHALRQLGHPVLSFYDHLPQGVLDADIVVNPALDDVAPSLRDMAPHATWLLGPRYVLLRRELRRALSAQPLPLARRAAVLVAFGGSDPARLTLPVTKALRGVLPDDLAIDVMLGGSVPDREQVAAGLAELGPTVRVHIDAPDMGRLMRQTGLAISAAGVTLGELAAFAVPTIAVVVAENQESGARHAAELGWCRAIDGRSAEPAAEIAVAAAELWDDQAAREAMQRRAQATVDGQGVSRLCQALLALDARED